MRSPSWLNRSIVGTIIVISVLAVGWSLGCMAASYRGNPYGQSEACNNHDDRAIQVMTALLATLISLKSNPPEDDDDVGFRQR